MHDTGATDDSATATRTVPVVVLVGPPGAGKTSVGLALAERLGLPFRDTDTDIEAQAGTAVSEIFVADGEPRFRELEKAAVASALTEHGGVLALGGGAVLDEGTRALLGEHTVVFLDVSLAAAAHRVGLDSPRPLLIGNPRATLRRQLEERRTYYEEVATAIVETSDHTPEEIAATIVRVIDAAPVATDPS